MTKAVLFSEVVAWVEKNKHRTWHREDAEGNFLPGLHRTNEIKYFTFHLDTRDMRVYHIVAEGYDDLEVVASEKEDGFEGTILDLLDQKLNEAYKRWEEKCSNS